MEIKRIGKKVIDKEKITRKIDKILSLRGEGFSQSRVARELKIERSFISRVERIGEVRKGEKIALIGFPVKNKNELEELAKEFGLEFVFLLQEEERWEYIKHKSGLELFNNLMEMMVKLKEFDLIIFLGSDMRLDLVGKLMEGKTVGIELGESPIEKDVYVDPEDIREVINSFS
ncbi:MAG: hypothetical protein ACLFT4_06260 [Bacteroidales bacterium]